MIDKNIYPVGSGLISAIRKIDDHIARQELGSGGSADKPSSPKPPIDLSEYLELGLKLSTLSDSERESIKFMLDKLGLNKK